MPVIFGLIVSLNLTTSPICKRETILRYHDTGYGIPQNNIVTDLIPINKPIVENRAGLPFDQLAKKWFDLRRLIPLPSPG